MKFSEIKKELLQPHWNISAVARSIGVSPASLHSALKIDNPGVLLVEKLSDYLESRSMGASADES